MTAAVNSPSEGVALLSEARQGVLRALKELGRATIPQLANHLAVSTEAVRQLLTQLGREGWIRDDCEDAGVSPETSRPLGRPASVYCLSLAGDHLFEKQYGALAIVLLDHLDEEALASLTDERVARLKPGISATASLALKAERLRTLYSESDPYITVDQGPDGPRIIETNCPFLAVALERPALCSTTVSTLRRLLGHEVVREERFQDHDGRCVFQVYAGRPLSQGAQRLRFALEPPKLSSDSAARRGA